MRVPSGKSRFYGSALAASVAATLLGSPAALAAPLRVGPGKAYATPCEAVAAAAPNDEIQIEPGTYTDSCAISLSGLTMRGVGGRPKIDLSATDHPAQYKGIYVVSANDVTFENLELTGAHISASNGENAAAIRIEGEDVTVRGCVIHDNQNGILGGSAGTLTVEYSEFYGNGVGDGCNGGGCTHNLYIGQIDTLYFRYNWSHALASDTADKGHLLKSRAAANYIEYNRFTGENGFDSYELDLPNGGLAVLIGNVIQKSAASGNGTLFSWGEEGIEHADKRVFLVNNTFVNDKASGTFIRANGATLAAKNNLFVGPGMVSSTGSLSADNLNGIDPSFVDEANYDYHLEADSPAIGKAVAAGSADAYSLLAAFEYVHPLAGTARLAVHDVGAYEHGTPTGATPPPDAGAPPSDASGRDDAGGSTGATVDSGSTVSSQAQDSGAAPAEQTASGGCAVDRPLRPSAGALLPWLLGCVLWVRRRRSNCALHR